MRKLYLFSMNLKAGVIFMSLFLRSTLKMEKGERLIE